MDIQVLEHYGEDHASSGHLYLTRLIGKDREQCNTVIEKMAEAGIATNVHYKPLPMMTAYKNLGFETLKIILMPTICLKMRSPCLFIPV